MKADNTQDTQDTHSHSDCIAWFITTDDPEFNLRVYYLQAMGCRVHIETHADGSVTVHNLGKDTGLYDLESSLSGF